MRFRSFARASRGVHDVMLPLSQRDAATPSRAGPCALPLRYARRGPPSCSRR